MDSAPETNQTPESDSEPQDTSSKLSRAHNLKKLFPAALLLLGIGVGYVLGFSTDSLDGDNNDTPPQEATVQNTQNQVVPDVEQKEIETVVEDVEYTWQNPELVEPLPLFEDLFAHYGLDPNEVDSEYNVVAQHRFYQVGTSGSEKAYVMTAPPQGLGPNTVLFFTEDEDVFTLYLQNSNSNYFYAEQNGQEAQYQGPKLAANVEINRDTFIDDIAVEGEIVYQGQKLSTAGQFFSAGVSFNPEPEPTPPAGSDSRYVKLGEVPSGTLYEFVSSEDTDGTYKISSFTLQLKNHTTLSYTIRGELSASKIDPIVWNDGTENEDDYASVGRGCGSSSLNEVALNIDLDDLTKIGESRGGQTVYGFKDPNRLLLTKHYDEYDSVNENFFAEGDRGLTFEEFSARRPVYVVEDAIGRFLVFSNQRYVPEFGCAKPVIYLYPESPVDVDVRVGADVTISDPLYPEGGWKDVLALPNGDLFYQNNYYDSLFWEGFGYGEYPEVNRGFVVAREDVESTWREHLQIMNLNKKEIDDFVEFWIDHIPNDPYVRISWIDTPGMNRLAPLYISERIDTSIRVFIDMEGLDRPIDIPEQVLIGKERLGFTLVEWGGLARDGSVPKFR